MNTNTPRDLRAGWFRILLAVAVLAAHAARADTVYSRLMEEFDRHDHRRPGSDAFASSLRAVSNELARAGFQPHVQSFNTLVPETVRCEVTFRGQPVTPVYPFDHGVSPLVTDGPLSGPIVWCGAGRLEDIEGKDLRGAIALLDFDAPRLDMAEVFMAGAHAVLFVGNGRASQWNVARVCHLGPAMIPRLYLDRATAEAAGLLDGEGETLTLDVEVRLRDVVGYNLWVERPGLTGHPFRLGRDEAVILSARLDTYGAVPDYCPDRRFAANAALLAQVAADLAQAPPPARSVFIVFFGAHYGAQEGARHFYYAAHHADARETASLEYRENRYQEELADITRLHSALDRPDLFAARDPAARDLTQLFKEQLVARVNNANAELSRLRMASEPSDPASDPHDPSGTAKEAGIAALVKQKATWNALRQQIINRTLDRSDATGIAAATEILSDLRSNLDQRAREVRALIAHTATSRILAARFSGKAVVAHFDFDFANDHQPWLFSVMGSYNMVSGRGVNLGSFLMHFAELGRIYSEIHAAHPDWAAPLFEDALNPYYKPFSLCVPTQRSVPTVFGIPLGCVGFQMMTVGDPLDTDAMPVRSDVRLDGLAGQMTAFCSALANHEGISLRAPLPKENLETQLTYLFTGGNEYKGYRFVNYARTSSDIEGPAGQAILVYQSGENPGDLAGLSRYAITRILAQGYVFAPMITVGPRTHWARRATALGFDGHGRLDRCISGDEAGRVAQTRLPLFYAHGGAAFSYGFAPDLLGATDVNIANKLNAKTDAVFKHNNHVYFSPGPVAFYADRPGRFKSIGDRGELLLGSTPQAPTGLGVPLDADAMLRMDAVRQEAEDYWRLNESRLEVLRRRNIVNDGLELLHAEAKEHLDQSRAAAAEKHHRLARAHQVLTVCLENRVYGPLRGITDDLVKAVVVLLLLNIPFAFAVERLVFGFTSIYRQVVAFAAVFMATFGILYITHPAFALASSPPIIFLAFVIILLSAITVSIVMGKIRREIRAIQGLASTVHASENDRSTALAAVLIGISGMRNRPLKTWLTAITVILLTFTILVFASFTSELGVVRSYLGKGWGGDRIEMTRFSRLDIPPPLVDAIQTVYGKDFHVCVRGGMFMNPTRSYDQGLTPLAPDRVLLNPANGETVGFGAIMGIESDELKVGGAFQGLLPEFNPAVSMPPLFLPASAVRKLGVKPGDPLTFAGRAFQYAGEVNTAVLRQATAIDGARLMPPDFESTVKNMGASAESGTSVQALEQINIGDLAWFSPEAVAVAPLERLHDAFGEKVYDNAITLYPHSPDADLDTAADTLARLFQGAVHVQSADGARRMFFTRAVKGSGFGDVVVPLLLGGLIIFSSLMGSIVDREKEIFTYSALGLSPPDVGCLFFAESAVYSVVGGMGGYLLSQLVAKALTILGRYGIVSPPPMNFSSLSSVSTILIVMAVVMLSTIYPAYRAGKSANPGVARKWKMPAPQGDRLDFVFPFTVSRADFSGIVSFIREHFINHGDATLGSFAARDVGLFQTPNDGLGIQAQVSLAPFDLGLCQDFKMYSRAFDIPGIEEVVVEMRRIGGSPSAWLRGNRMFADELRRQFLFWRSLPIETIEHYRRLTGQALKTAEGSPPESATPDGRGPAATHRMA